MLMLSFLPWPLLLVINLILIPLNSIVIATPMTLLGVLRFCLPFKAVLKFIEKCNAVFYRIWVINNNLAIRLTNKINWHITGDAIPTVRRSCIVISNHLSWADILVISMIYGGKLPITKFFMKHSLIYIPFVGLACYAIGMPFLRRYPKEKLLKNPQLRNRDIMTTKAACRRLALSPSTLINFVEGTRYTPPKAKIARSPYEHLMPPKVASVAIALGEIGRDIDYVFNTTLSYPHNAYPNKPFIDLLKGRLTDICADIRLVKVSPELVGDYLNDKNFKHEFTMHMREVWKQKDETIKSQLKQLENN